jgi:protein SCO1/2
MRQGLLIFFIILLAGIAIAYTMLSKPRKLKVFNPAELNPEVVDASMRNVFSKHRIGNFELTDQYGNPFTPSDLEQTIYVTDFFFTTCPSICIDMSKELMRVQEAFKAHEDVKIVSHTVQPEVDSVPVLSTYAKRHDAIPGKWIFATGDKQQLYALARKAYFAVKSEGNGDESDFIHTENFVLIDKEKRIRGFYNGTSTEDVDRLIEEIQLLLKEYEN